MLEASELAALLNIHQVPIAILNACQSGKQVGASETSLGSHLMQAGVQLVLAMGYSVTVSAAELLMQTLYTHLFAKDDLSIAIRHARTELYNHKERRAYFDELIDLEDWLLPVTYQNQSPTLQVREFTPEESKAYYEHLTELEHTAPPEPTYGFVGRDLDILQIEKRLLMERNILLVRGMGGAGKTTLLRHLGAWWRTTGFVNEVFYFGYDERAWTRQQLMVKIAQKLLDPVAYVRDFQPLTPDQQQTFLTKMLRAEHHLLILDNLESITGAHLAIRHTLSAKEQKALHSFLKALSDGRTIVLLGSRGGEDWLAPETFADNIYNLPGLDPEAASTLVDRILAKHNAARYRDDTNLQHLLKLLDGFPLALEVVLPNLVHTTPTEILSALHTGDVQLDIEESKQQGKDIFEQKTESILRCIDYSHSNLSPEAQQLLLCLTPFTSVFYINLLEQYIAQLKQQPLLASLPFDRFQEVLQEPANWGLLTPDPDISRFLRLQPILPYFLRNRMSDPQQAPRKAAIETAFREHYDQVGNTLDDLIRSKEPQERQIGMLVTGLEYENLITALNLALAAQESIAGLYNALMRYLDSTQKQARGLELFQTTIEQLSTYPADKLTCSSGIELASIIGTVANWQCDLKQYEKAEKSCQKLLGRVDLLDRIDKEVKDKLKAAAYHSLGMVALNQRKWAKAEQYYQQALLIYVEYNTRFEQASTYHQLGMIAQEQHKWAESEQYYQQALHIYVECNVRFEQANANHNLGIVAQKQHKLTEAKRYYQQALLIKIEYNAHFEQASTYHQLGMVAQEQRKWAEAEQYYQQALHNKIEYNARYEQAGTYGQLGLIAQEQQQWVQAREYLLQALKIFMKYNDAHSSRATVRNLARLWRASGNVNIPAMVAERLGMEVTEVEKLFREVVGEDSDGGEAQDGQE